MFVTVSLEFSSSLAAFLSDTARVLFFFLAEGRGIVI